MTWGSALSPQADAFDVRNGWSAATALLHGGCARVHCIAPGGPLKIGHCSLHHRRSPRMTALSNPADAANTPVLAHSAALLTGRRKTKEQSTTAMPPNARSASAPTKRFFLFERSTGLWGGRHCNCAASQYPSVKHRAKGIKELSSEGKRVPLRNRSATCQQLHLPSSSLFGWLGVGSTPQSNPASPSAT